MSTPRGRRFDSQDIQGCQNQIETYLHSYMTKEEIFQRVGHQRRNLFDFVWGKLEEQNPEFFQAYHTRLRVIAQIHQFNELVDRQTMAMRQHSLPPSRRRAAPPRDAYGQPRVPNPRSMPYPPGYYPDPMAHAYGFPGPMFAPPMFQVPMPYGPHPGFGMPGMPRMMTMHPGMTRPPPLPRMPGYGQYADPRSAYPSRAPPTDPAKMESYRRGRDMDGDEEWDDN